MPLRFFNFQKSEDNNQPFRPAELNTIKTLKVNHARLATEHLCQCYQCKLIISRGCDELTADDERLREKHLQNTKPKTGFLNMFAICNPLRPNIIVQRGLDMQLRSKQARHLFVWLTLNVLVLSILLVDLSNKCPFAQSKWYYLEYVVIFLVVVNIIVSAVKYFFYLFCTEAVHCTEEQKSLLTYYDNDNSFIVDKTPKANEIELCNTSDTDIPLLNWHSSFNDSRLSSTNWNYSRTTPPRASLSPQQQRQSLSPQRTQFYSPQQQQNMSSQSTVLNSTSFNMSTLSSNTSFSSPYSKYARDDLIADERSLQQYLREVSQRESSRIDETADMSQTFNNNSINSFWNYCNTAANLLKTSIYQLAPTTPPVTQNKQTAKDEAFNFIDSNSEVIKRISSEKLSRYVANLRMWLSTTILERVAKEIEKIDDSFKNRGFVDMKIGNIGLERLKKTVENQHFVNQYMPMLPLIVPFLEMSTNQEYLVQRLKDLAKGSCIADYRWNSGSSYHGLKWDEHLPTDSAILFHVFCVYLDSQLMPLPQGGGRPFYSRYVIIGDEKRSSKDTIAAVQNKAHCAILCSNPLKPKFNFISEHEIHNCAYDRNNLFYVIIQFLLYMKTHQESALEGVNLGKSGINVMCVIED